MILSNRIVVKIILGGTPCMTLPFQKASLKCLVGRL